MKETQLELALWKELWGAQQIPETVEVVQILDTMEIAAAQLTEAARLQFAGEALLQIAELCAARANALMTEWEESYRDPVIQQGFLSDLVRQTMAVDLSDLMEPTPPRKPRSKRAKSIEPSVSIVATIDKAALLAMVDQLESEAAIEKERKQQVLQIAYDESVSQWIEAIAQWLKAVPNNQASFQQLCQSLGMSRVEVWLGLLLGEFELKPGEEFYSEAFWVKAVSVNRGAATDTNNFQLDACQNFIRGNYFDTHHS